MLTLIASTVHRWMETLKIMHPTFTFQPTSKKKNNRPYSIRSELARSKQNERQKNAGSVFNAWLNWQQELVRLGSKNEIKKIQPNNLIAHIPLDEGKEGKINNKVAPKDPKAKPEVGKLTNVKAWTNGRIKGAVKILDEKSYIEFPRKTATLAKNSPFTISAWVKTKGDVDGVIAAKMEVKNRISGMEVRANKKKVSFILSQTLIPPRSIQVETELDLLKPDQWHHVAVSYDGSKRAVGVTIYVDGRVQKTKTLMDSMANYTPNTNSPLTIGFRGIRKGEYQKPLIGGSIDDVKVFSRRLLDSEVISAAFSDLVEETIKTPEQKRTAAQNDLLKSYYFSVYDTPYLNQEKEIEKARKENIALLKRTTTTMVFREAPQPKQAFILVRGEYDKKGEPVVRNTPAVLPDISNEYPKDRLGLAKWLTEPGHPLTARVTVNRFWQQFFGVGLVKTSEDFGSQGEPPSHPKLLDWLAVDFRENGWNVKRLMKQIAMSSTYRQASNVNSELIALDPHNRLYARGPRFRMDAEVIRDQALSLSGLLVDKMGGPSVKPPQPDGLWFAVGYSGSNTVRFTKDTGADKVYRRSLYTFIKRTSPPPQMSTLDSPNRESCVVRRERTNTPLQALLLMNDAQFVEAAKFFGQRMMKEGGKSPEERIRWAFLNATARNVTKPELAIFLKAQEAFQKEYQANPESAKKLLEVGETKADEKLNPAELASWCMIGNLILNLDEVVTKE